MVANWRQFNKSRLDAPLRAALECFAANGYHGTSIRMVADAAGLSVPGLYHHHRSKQELLDSVVSNAMDELLSHCRSAADDFDGTAAGRFDNVVTALILFHLSRRHEAFVASTEMRSMISDIREKHIESRDTVQTMISDAIAEGVSSGDCDCRSPSDAARAISSLCVSIATWFQPDGALNEAEVTDLYLGYCQRIAEWNHVNTGG